jgi:hypothetical protein
MKRIIRRKFTVFLQCTVSYLRLEEHTVKVQEKRRLYIAK